MKPFESLKIKPTMKNILTFLIIPVLLLSCSGGGEEPTPPGPEPAENTAPTIPSLSSPANNFVCIENPIDFQWGTATDEQGDPITYQLQIATDANFTLDIDNYSTSSTSAEVSLELGQLYFWRVKAVDGKNLSGEYSQAFNFFTEGNPEINHLPFAPGLEWPEMDSEQTIATIELKWFAEDADGDSLVFDVYFGADSANLTKIASDIDNNVLNVDLPSAATYYWNVVVKDGNGGTTHGQTWIFTKI